MDLNDLQNNHQHFIEFISPLPLLLSIKIKNEYPFLSLNSFQRNQVHSEISKLANVVQVFAPWARRRTYGEMSFCIHAS